MQQQKEATTDSVDTNFDTCGEWNHEDDARSEASRVFDEVNRNVVML